MGQDSTIVYVFDFKGLVSTGTNNPFWIHANKYGTVPSTSSFVLGQAGIYKVYNANNPRFFQVSAGALLNGNLSKSSDFFFQDLFITGKAGPIELLVGQKAEMIGLADSTLSMGSLALSQNFRPYPKIQIATPHFTKILPNFDFIKFKFSYSDGLLGAAQVGFGNVSRVPDVYLHQKSLYLKFGKVTQKLNLILGFNHQAMWGGEDKIFSGGLKKSEAYHYVIIGKPWADSRVGNHFGTIDAGIELKGNHWNVFAYRQNIYEDGSLANLSNVLDGLTGIRFKRAVPSPKTKFSFNTILFEYLYTKSQGGNDFDFTTGIFGKDNYYNHYVYTQGWSYKGLSMGTPLIDAQKYYREGVAKNNSLFTTNNRIFAFNLGLEATFHEFHFQFKGTYSRNFGTYDIEYTTPLSQSSFIFKTEKAFSSRKNNHLSLSIASDFGKLYNTNTALMIGWKKTGFLN